MYDLVVIGGGAGGLQLAKAAARVGASVALIERRGPGAGGAIAASLESKALIQATNRLAQIRRADHWGLRIGELSVDFAAVMARARQIADDLARRDSDAALKEAGIDVSHGSASFEAYDTLSVNANQRINGYRFVIATGSRPAIPDIPGLDESGFLDEHSLFELSKAPEHLIVLGAESVAIELAQSLARLGSKVTVLAEAATILSEYEPEAAAAITKSLSAEGVTFTLGAKLTKVELRGSRKVCHYAEVATGATGELVGSDILITAGRVANIEGLNLQAVGIHADAQHGVEVDECLQTHSARAFALGDVLLRRSNASATAREADVVLHNAVLRMKKKIDYSGLPSAAFTDPEVASVGITEREARAQELPCRVYRVDFEDVDRALVDGRPDGFAKVVVTPSGKILGATVVGEDAAMIVQEFVLALERGLSLRDLEAATPVYPTYGAVARLIAEQHRATRFETGLFSKALRFFYGFAPRGATGNGATSTAPANQPPVEPPAHHGH
jgi:pyruvate/2-oxoglutarate dehydrogenase complex dihydrolipoamide dehydrogenase (E3) component